MKNIKMLMKSFFIGNRSMRKADIAITIAFTSVNPDTSHCTVGASTPVSAIIVGSAGFISV
jgi:hypothetical protein